MHGFDFSVHLFHTCIRGTRIVVTLELVSNVLRVPRVEFPKYPGCERLRTVSKDKLKYAFCERPSNWGKHQFTYCLGFAKGPRFLTWSLLLISILSLIITLSQSLVLSFCCPFLSISL